MYTKYERFILLLKVFILYYMNFTKNYNNKYLFGID